MDAKRAHNVMFGKRFYCLSSDYLLMSEFYPIVFRYHKKSSYK